MVTVQPLERLSTGADFLSVQPQPQDTTVSPNQQLLPLSARLAHSNTLEIGGCSVVELVEQFGSPLYILDESTLRAACRQYIQGLQQHYPGVSQVLYASKAWSCVAVCAVVASEGLGLDVVSGGELYTGLTAGVDPTQIYLHGNNKSVEELRYAIDVGATIIVDNWLELNHLVDLAKTAERPIRAMLRITPGIECHTHDYIRTGHLDSKFGFDPNQLPDVLQFAQQHPEIEWVGLHAHIGSQIFELQPHQDLTGVIADGLAIAQSYGLPMNELNVGGGLGIRYTESDDPPSIADWCQVIGEGVAAACRARSLPLPKLICEPGRSLIGTACVTAYRVGSQKTVPGIRTYISVDGGMSDNPRPITYQSQYRAMIANRMGEATTETVTVAGKHCESGDILLKDVALPPCSPGDILVVMTTGAYNYSMASNYNRLSRPAAVLVQDGEASLILQRETYADLVRQDCFPERLRSSRES
ncbi:MAG: diaminopimelate decarboxylase [Thermosynechococcaceae cyanobacterium]